MKKLSKKILSVLLVITMIVTAGSMTVTSSAATVSIPDDAVEFNGHYYKAYEIQKNWEDAKTACENMGGHLATITSQAENDFVFNLIDGSYYYTFRIGLTDQSEEGIWLWITGEYAVYTNWATGQPDNDKTYVDWSGQHTAVIVSEDTSYGCEEAHWDDESPLTGIPYICEWESIADIPGEHFPAGYNFKEDRWNFRNINETIALDYYIGMYEEQKGTELYNFRGETAAHGHCFGMATSTAATLINIPYVTDYIAWTGSPYTKLSSVNKGTMNKDMDISAKDYIKYCHVYQYSASVERQRQSDSHKGIRNVYNAVKNAALTNTDCTLIVIDLWGGPGGHSVYAVGIDGDDILVNDSNEPGSIQRIDVNGSSWKYSAAGFTWDSSVNATINYVDDVITPYMNLVWNVPVEGMAVNSSLETSMSYSEDDEIDGTISYYSNYIEPIDTDKLLVVSGNDSFSFSESEKMYAIKNTDGDDSEDLDGLYWLDSGDTINAENISDESAILKLVGNELKITAEMPVDSSAEMTVNENGDNKATFDVKDDDKFSITFTTLDDSKQFIETTLTGTANGDEVVASETEDGIQVTGLNDITVTYETPDGTSETTADVTDGSTVNITVNDDENTVETDWQDKEETETDEECKHSDANHDGICDACSEDFTKGCSCNCHGNAFMQFLHKIVSFLRKLFGMTQYQYCNCGKAHW